MFDGNVFNYNFNLIIFNYGFMFVNNDNINVFEVFGLRFNLNLFE